MTGCLPEVNNMSEAIVIESQNSNVNLVFYYVNLVSYDSVQNHIFIM